MANIFITVTPAPGHVNPTLSVARHLSSLGHSITFLLGSLFRDQAVALGFQFVPFSGAADFDYRRLDEEFPEIAAAKPGPEAMYVYLDNSDLMLPTNHLSSYIYPSA
jgi:UDP:flavonoid glycosyltransferase YjiC (YdhE family)